MGIFDQSQIDQNSQDITGISGYNQFFPKQSSKMYSSIYKQVVNDKKSPRQAFAAPENSAFDSYRHVWNKYQDTHDRGFQKELTAKNREIVNRMQEADERRKHQLINKKSEAMWKKEEEYRN